jgi:hypothetical protein|tara:strand:+ start:4276 stop:5121 length:846 start_codon:yes stop_codon:yes gene_type:complete
MTTFRDQDPNSPGVQLSQSIGATVQSVTKQVKKRVNQYRSGIEEIVARRSVNIPKDAVPKNRTTTDAKIIDSAGDNDWRVSISIPPVIGELDSSLMAPLVNSGNRLIFPFTPSVIFSHQASYSSMQPVHSNYPFYNYQNSAVDAIVVSGDFFIETNEDAEYWVAAVTYLRTLTKMFYGDNGANTGNPPPIVKFNGYGEYVFKNVPCVVTSFNVDMPQDVDYLKTNIAGGDVGTNESEPGTWVPAQSLIAVTLQPIYSRQHVEQFNLNDFVSGNLISTRGFL